MDRRKVAGYWVGGVFTAPEASLSCSYYSHPCRDGGRLHELYDSDKKVSKKVEEAKGRLEVAMVDGELQGIQDLIRALLREEEVWKERRRREEAAGGDDMEDTAFVEEAGSSEEVGVRVELGKRRKVAKQRRFSGIGVREVQDWMLRRWRRSGSGACVLLLCSVMRKVLDFRMRIQVEQPFVLLHLLVIQF